MKYLFLLIAGYLLTRAVLPFCLKIMTGFGLTANNYQGKSVPMPAGLIPATVFLFMVAISTIWFQSTVTWSIFAFCLILVCLGIADDLKGTSEHKGFRGHFKALFRGKITTGITKVAVGGLLALAAAWVLSEKRIDILAVNTLLIALSTNLINLMDLRPGRAIKIFLVMSLLLLWLGQCREIHWLIPLTGSVLAYCPCDLRAKGMLGDTGANLLGFVLGLALVEVLGIQGKIVVLGFLLAVHFYAEKFSISALIEERPWLKYLDELGRPDYVGGDGAD